MLMCVLAGILFLSKIAHPGRPSYEDILIKAKNNQLSAPDGSDVEPTGQSKLFIFS